MAESLNPLQYGTVVGRFLVELGDSDDPDLTPDVFPVRGYVVFTPATSYANVKEAQPAPATIFPQQIYGILDSEGYLCSVRMDNKGIPIRTASGEMIPSARGIRMQASSDPYIIPSNWTWNVRFNFEFNNTSIPYDSFNFTLDPLQVADLSYIKPISQNGGTITITGPAGPPGQPGPKGDTGPSTYLSVGNVTTSPTGTNPTVTITGNVPNQVINFSLPQGPVGPSGGPIPTGGTANQLIRKTDSGGYEWFNPSHDKPIALESGLDLDTVLTPNDYHQSGNAGASSGSNYPVPFAGYLQVRASGSFIYQYYTVYATAGGNAGKQFARAKYGSTWTSWAEVGASYSPATSTADGLMSSADKAILDESTATATANRIVKRDASGLFSVKTPTATAHPTPKSYVDTQVSTATAEVGETRSIVDKSIDCSKHLFIGDSISSLPTDQIEGRSYTIFVPAMSEGKLFRKHSIALSGNRADQQLTRLRTLFTTDTDFTSASIMVGTNELSQEVAMSTWQTNVNTLVTELRAKNIEPILMTLPPRSGPIRPTSPDKILQWNNWIKEYAYNNDLLHVDVWSAVADPATREYKTGYFDTSDGVHTNGRGQMAIANEFIRKIGPHMKGVDPGSPNILTPEANDRLNILPVGIFESDATPTGWVLTNASMIRDSNAPGGFAIDIDVNNPSGNVQAYPSKVTGGFTGGDTIRVILKARIVSSRGVYSGAGMQLLIRTWQGTAWTDAPLNIFGQNLVTRDYLEYAQDFKLPAGTDGLSLYWKYDKGTSPAGLMHSRVASMGVYNLKNALL